MLLNFFFFCFFIRVLLFSVYVGFYFWIYFYGVFDDFWYVVVEDCNKVLKYVIFFFEGQIEFGVSFIQGKWDCFVFVVFVYDEGIGQNCYCFVVEISDFFGDVNYGCWWVFIYDF